MRSSSKFPALLMGVWLCGNSANWKARVSTLDRPPMQGNAQAAQTGDQSLRMEGRVKKGDHLLAPPGAPKKGSPDDSSAIQKPPFVRHPVLFLPDRWELGKEGRKLLKAASAWLRGHPETRVLIVGYCDSSGSETCNHTLAERRGSAVHQFLLRSGIDPNQIAGVKGWDTMGQPCRTNTERCQQLNRSVRLFIASPGTPVR
jgi:outer membrane protein OmpA-like peptidoglycan-associated protein